MHSRFELQFIPARGRKHFNVAPLFSDIHIAIYPREGTETLFTHFRHFSNLFIAIYPREGTETAYPGLSFIVF